MNDKFNYKEFAVSFFHHKHHVSFLYTEILRGIFHEYSYPMQSSH